MPRRTYFFIVFLKKSFFKAYWFIFYINTIWILSTKKANIDCVFRIATCDGTVPEIPDSISNEETRKIMQKRNLYVILISIKIVSVTFTTFSIKNRLYALFFGGTLYFDQI